MCPEIIANKIDDPNPNVEFYPETFKEWFGPLLLWLKNEGSHNAKDCHWKGKVDPRDWLCINVPFIRNNENKPQDPKNGINKKEFFSPCFTWVWREETH